VHQNKKAEEAQRRMRAVLNAADGVSKTDTDDQLRQPVFLGLRTDKEAFQKTFSHISEPLAFMSLRPPHQM
jgi:hypothetical protein